MYRGALAPGSHDLMAMIAHTKTAQVVKDPRRRIMKMLCVELGSPATNYSSFLVFMTLRPR